MVNTWWTVCKGAGTAASHPWVVCTWGLHRRSSVVPEVPSLADAGVQGLQLEIWNAVAAPVAMPNGQTVMAKAVEASIREIREAKDSLEDIFLQAIQGKEAA